VITTSAAHGLATGAITTISGVRGNTAANGAWKVHVISPTQLSLDGSVGNAAYTSKGTWSGCAGASCKAEIDKYDAVIFGCVGGEESKDGRSLLNVRDYANKGGRVFATHYAYVWLNSPSTWSSTVNAWDPANELNWDNGTVTAAIDTSFAKGKLFATWLQAPVKPFSATYAPPYAAVNALSSTSPPMIALTEPRRDITPAAANVSTSGVVAPAQRWIYTTNDNGKTCASGAACKTGVCTGNKCVGTVVESGADPAATDAPMHYTFNTDTAKLPAEQCGRVLYSDFHVSVGGNTYGKSFPAECNDKALTSQEKVLAYMLFDLASCVSATPPPACVPKSCQTQSLGCGLAGDGCGNAIDCGPCALGTTCGGGGVPSQCGAPTCKPRTCDVGACGKMGDGCGGTIDCGTCGNGTVCGGGGANVCGAGACVPSACPQPAPGSVCGPVANGCGAVNNCPCSANVPCVNGTCGAPVCVLRTCGEVGANCGTVADGCGGSLTCGTCIQPQTCGGGGTANLCGGGVN
jgi:hypothetical protein